MHSHIYSLATSFPGFSRLGENPGNEVDSFAVFWALLPYGGVQTS